MEMIGKIIGMNSSDGLLNITILDDKNNQQNIKTTLKDNAFILGNLYSFTVEKVVKERISYHLTGYHLIECIQQEDSSLRSFYKSAPYDLDTCKKEIENRVSQIINPVIHDIAQYLILAYEDRYFVYPAATRMHHAYVGGLAYHTIGMLDLADSFFESLSLFKKDYLYAGIILHDIGKILELTGIQNTEYTLDGQLLGHLVMGALEIQKAAIALGFENAKEVRILEHMLISHHGQPQFGAAKRPITPEAVALWYIDTIDSKFRVLGEELEKTEVGCFTDTIGVLDKIKIYKNE